MSRIEQRDGTAARCNGEWRINRRVAPDSVFIEANRQTRGGCSTTVSQIIPPPRMAPVLSDLHELSGCPPRPPISFASTPADRRALPPRVGRRTRRLRPRDARADPLAPDRAIEEENRAAWERGWQQNLDEARAARLRARRAQAEVLSRQPLPALAARHPRQREPADRVRPVRAGAAAAVRQVPVGIHTIYEIGSGSANNLWLLSELFPDARIVGLDWVDPAVQLASELGTATGRQIEGRRFDMLNPDPALRRSRAPPS